MNILFHTIAIEPARWTPQRVSRPLPELLPHIAATGFKDLEIFEPHLSGELATSKSAISEAGLAPVALSSYLSLNPVLTSDAVLNVKLEELAARVEYYDFKKVRLFPGPGMSPADSAGVLVFTKRLERVLERVRGVEILLETHDGSLADDPEVVARIVRDLAYPRLGLLFQPTNFHEPEAIREQFRIQKPYIRHVHLQNRKPDLSFARMEEGIVPWPELLAQLEPSIEATLEFVPVAICPPEQFDLHAALKQARAEADYVLGLDGRG